MREDEREQRAEIQARGQQRAREEKLSGFVKRAVPRELPALNAHGARRPNPRTVTAIAIKG